MAKAQVARRFVYQPRTKEDIRERATMRGGSFDSIIKNEFKAFKPKEGKNVIRILPPSWDGARHYGLDVYVNYGIGADEQSYLSLSKMLGKPDPIAEARKVAETEGDEEVSRALRPNQRILIWLIDRDAEEEGPQWWAAPFKFDKALANLSTDEDTKEVIFIDDPENGADVRFYKEGKGLRTTYDASRIKLLPRPLGEDASQTEDWLGFVQDHPLTSILNYYSYDHIQTVFNGAPAKPKAGEGEEQAPRQVRRAAPPPPSPLEAEDEDETPAPTVRRRAQPEPDPEEEVEQAAEPKKSSSIRERLQSRRSRVPAEEEE